jgi:HD-like signal output (HDOD) protein
LAVQQSRAVHNWIKQLNEKDMPVFSGTVAEVSVVVNSSDTSASDVANVVLRDASLTGRVLKAVNSFHFNPTNHTINTVSRAVMVMGFDQVRVLTLSMVLVDNLTQGYQRQKLIDEMASAFHAATQAQEFARINRVGDPEDLFVATLLSRLGKMAFWAFAGKQADDLLEKLESGMPEAEAEREVLGFELSELTRALSQEWHLGEVVNDYLHGRIDKNKAACINAGLALADAAKAGWESDEAQQAISELAAQFDLEPDELEQTVLNNALKARQVTELYGSKAASEFIPVAETEDQGLIGDTQTDNSEVCVGEAQPSGFPEPDIHYQMTVMQEISATVQERPSIGIILEMVLEGIYRGVGTDRAMFAMLNPERTHLSCKYLLGMGADKLREQLSIDVRRAENIFHQIIQSQKPRLLPGDPTQLGGTLSRETLSLLGKPPYMVMPAIVKNKVIGIFFADRNASGRPLTESDFLAFQQFCQQANMGLTILAMQG